MGTLAFSQCGPAAPTVTWQGQRRSHTGIWKTPVKGPRNGTPGLNHLMATDKGDLTGHGGERRARICLFRWISYR